MRPVICILRKGIQNEKKKCEYDWCTFVVHDLWFRLKESKLNEKWNFKNLFGILPLQN